MNTDLNMNARAHHGVRRCLESVSPVAAEDAAGEWFELPLNGIH